MNRIQIDPSEFVCRSTAIWGEQWLLLAAGKFPESCNAMTVGWGSFGTMWAKPFAMIVVRPQRYTMEFLEKYPTFTLSAFPEKYRPVLKLCGSRSGRDLDKFQAAGLTPEKALTAEAPAFTEAELVVECRKIYTDVFHKEGFIAPYSCADLYPAGDIHKVIFGEITAISAIEKYKGTK